MSNQSRTQIALGAILGLHAIGSVAWLVFMAGGFPARHPKFFANQILPWGMLLLVLFGVWALRHKNHVFQRTVLAAFAGGWMGATVAGILLFPISGRIPFVVGALVSLRICSVFRSLESPGSHASHWILPGLLGVIAGCAIPFTQRASTASTHPLYVSHTIPKIGSSASGTVAEIPGSIRLSQSLQVATGQGAVILQKRGLYVTVEPLLTFVSCSPDRCWSALAPQKFRSPPPRRLSAFEQDGSLVRLFYEDFGGSCLAVDSEAPTVAQIEATTVLSEPVYSHLNTFCELSLTGHRRLSLVFSPCPDQPIEVLPMEYPDGHPARLAYLDASNVFRVVEATSGEKGPYHELASGPLSRTSTLSVTLLDEGKAIAMITMWDWAQQSSCALSPTAGWSVPQNSIEFSLQENAPNSGASIFVSLASTSPGRGFDSVGHAAGVYRNHMTIRLLSNE